MSFPTHRTQLKNSSHSVRLVLGVKQQKNAPQDHISASCGALYVWPFGGALVKRSKKDQRGTPGQPGAPPTHLAFQSVSVGIR